jgi:hypothetical protein
VRPSGFFLDICGARARQGCGTSVFRRSEPPPASTSLHSQLLYGAVASLTAKQRLCFSFLRGRAILVIFCTYSVPQNADLVSAARVTSRVARAPLLLDLVSLRVRDPDPPHSRVPDTRFSPLCCPLLQCLSLLRSDLTQDACTFTFDMNAIPTWMSSYLSYVHHMIGAYATPAVNDAARVTPPLTPSATPDSDPLPTRLLPT